MVGRDRVGAVAALVLALACGHGLAAEIDAASAPPATQAIGRESPWPLAIAAGGATLTLYQPQLDAWDGHSLSARAAVRVELGKNPARTSYGIVTLNARTLTDKGTRVVTIDQAEIVKADFPSAAAAEAKAWAAAIASDLAGKSRSLALDRLEAQLAIAGAVKTGAAQALRNAPPRIIFSTAPAILVYIDGRPVYRAMQETKFERVINTRPLLLRDARGVHYLKLFDGWMSAATLAGPWSVVTTSAAELADAFRRATAAGLIDPLTGQAAANQPAPSLRQLAPVIYTATEPTELIVTDGEPKYAPIAETRLLYVENTTGHVFQDTVDNRAYVLISGRWFRARNTQGPWEYVAANALPADFAKIPDNSPVENVKASIPGTAQAQEAAVAAGIPQTAAVKIADTRLTPPRFDGDPVYKPIAGTALEYVVNTPTPLIRVERTRFYALQNGVWFAATAITGPWAVATSVPAAIYTIPPSSPLYYVTFVRIYALTGDTVYVGYTPGYQGTYIDPATGVVVYGTGYYYDPWAGAVWYGNPVTYGYAAAVAYTPWDGWAYGFGFGWFWGAATVAYGWGWGPYPYWGPWAYPTWGVAYGAAGGAVAWGPGGWAGYTGNIYTQWGNRATVSRAAGGYDAWTGNAWASQVGKSYNSRTGIVSAGQRGAVANVYSGNFAAGGRGVATGPGGNVVVGERATAGNVYTGDKVSANRGAYYDRNTGQWTSFGGATGPGGGKVAHVGDDVYAGKDGNVYRNTGSGWERHTAGGWQSVAGSAQGEATRQATGGLGGTRGQAPEGGPRLPSGGTPRLPEGGGPGLPAGGPEGRATRAAGAGLGGEQMHFQHMQQLDHDRFARRFGNERALQLRQSSFGMHRGFGGFRRR